MQRYVVVTGLVFALLVLAHVARVVAEGTRVASDPFFICTTLAAAALALWAFRLARRGGKGG